MNEQIPEKKKTVLGLYVNSAEAYDKWRAAPDEVKVLDVRTPEEFIFVGHPGGPGIHSPAQERGRFRTAAIYAFRFG